MAEIVESDESGRIVIPKSIRKELGIGKKTKFIITKRKEGQILLQKIDFEEMSRRLEEELEGVKVEEIAASVRKEINAKIAREHPELLTG